MKLPDFSTDDQLNSLRARMGLAADQFGSFSVEIAPGRLTVEELDKLTTGEGIDVAFSEITRLPDGTLVYKDSRVLVYIRDIRPFRGHINLPKYHFSYCATLDNMVVSGKFSKYVIATEVTGSFRVNFLEGGGARASKEKLDVCQNCLDKLSFDGFALSLIAAHRRKIVSEFTPGKFFEQYPRQIIPVGGLLTADIAPIDDYSPEWNEKSRSVRAAANWTCQQCSLVLDGDKRKFLHAHHLSGVRSDNRPSNLRVLCIGCHSAQPMHGHIKALPEFKTFINATGWRQRS